MADGVNVSTEEYQKRIHSSTISGHVHKGHGVVAASASIPTKFQTIVTENSDKKGFLMRAKRFRSDENTTDAPAPGEYTQHGKFEMYSPSFSKKGTGTFASKSKRGTKFIMSNAPGPGIYALPSFLMSRKDFGRSVQAVFAPPIAENVEKNNGVPAPNIYNVMKIRLGRTNNVVADAAFKSTSKRELLNTAKQSRIPAPCQYNVNDNLTHDSVKVPYSCFKSQSKRESQKLPEYPGPGHYKPNEPVEPANRLIFPRKHYLCISAPAMPLPQTPPLPGPGSYEVVDYAGPVKHYMSGSSFVSTTGRWTGNIPGNTADMPGPAHYRPGPLGRQSFIYNAAGRWI